MTIIQGHTAARRRVPLLTFAPATPRVPETWLERAACRGVDPELFYPTRGDSTYREARAVCAACPVSAQCLAEAMEHENATHRFGMWGGTSPEERERIARKRGAS